MKPEQEPIVFAVVCTILIGFLGVAVYAKGREDEKQYQLNKHKERVK